jgi:hypothetical protein
MVVSTSNVRFGQQTKVDFGPAPRHDDVNVPQNVSWESGIQLARKSVFM